MLESLLTDQLKNVMEYLPIQKVWQFWKGQSLACAFESKAEEEPRKIEKIAIFFYHNIEGRRGTQ